VVSPVKVKGIRESSLRTVEQLSGQSLLSADLLCHPTIQPVLFLLLQINTNMTVSRFKPPPPPPPLFFKYLICVLCMHIYCIYTFIFYFVYFLYISISFIPVFYILFYI